MHARVARALLLVLASNELARQRRSLWLACHGLLSRHGIVDRFASMGFCVDPELLTLLHTCASCGGCALMSVKQAVRNVAAMFGVTPRQNLKISSTSLLSTCVLPLRAQIWPYDCETKSRSKPRNRAISSYQYQCHLVFARRSAVELGALSYGEDMRTAPFWQDHSQWPRNTQW